MFPPFALVERVCHSQSPQPQRPTQQVHCEAKRADNNGNFDQALSRMSEFEMDKKKKKPEKPDPPPPKPHSLSGLWTFSQGDNLVPDHGAAIKKGHEISTGVPAPHGTYIKKKWYRIYHETDNLFYLFDDNGDLAVFEFQTAENLKADRINPGDFPHPEVEAWKQRPSTKAVVFEVKAGDEHAPQGRKLELLPRLALVPKDKVQPDLPGKWCPSVVSDEIGQQYLYWDKVAKSIYWLPGKPKTLAGNQKPEEGLEFVPFDEPTSRTAAEPQKEFGDIFRGQTHFPNLDYPFYGFNPSAKKFGSKAREKKAAAEKKTLAAAPKFCVRTVFCRHRAARLHKFQPSPRFLARPVIRIS
jgi:hypothetical protein